MCLSGALSDGRLNQESRYVRLMLQDSYQRPMLLRQVKRDPAVFRKYLDGNLHLLSQRMRRLTLQLSILVLFFTTEPDHSQTIQATVWKLIQDLIWKMKTQNHQIILQLYHISQLPIFLLFGKGYYLRNRNKGKCACCNLSQDD